MSVRNIDSDLALSKLNDLFDLHRYDDCVLFVNRLNHLTLKEVVQQLPIDLYLSRLPHTIEIFEAIYAKIFIIEPDKFPARTLKPDRLIDKMIAYFSFSNYTNSNELSQLLNIEPIDSGKLLDSFENVIRIISYVQPNLYSRLLFFKYAIDRALLKFDKDIQLFNKSLSNTLKNESNIKNSNKGPELSLIVSRAVNLQSCESVRLELTQTLENTHKASARLNDYMTQLKSEKIYKEVENYLNELNLNVAPTSPQISNRKRSLSGERSKSNNNKRDEANKDKERNLALSKSKTSVSLHRNNYTTETICQSFVQHRLYLNKAMMNVIEPYLIKIKIQEILSQIYEKIDLDKQILLVYSHLKKEENYLSAREPLQPLFKRYALGFERCIQIWRKKCYADNLALLSDNPVNESSDEGEHDFNLTSTKSKFKHSGSSLALDKINYFNEKHKQYSSYNLNACLRSKYSKSDALSIAPQNRDAQSILSSNFTLNLLNNVFDDAKQAKNQKFTSEVNLNESMQRGVYSTLPTRLRSAKKRAQFYSYLVDNNNNDLSDDHLEQDVEEELSNLLKKRSNKVGSTRPALTKNCPTQTQYQHFDDDDDENSTIKNEQLKNEIKKLNDSLKCANDLILKFQRDENTLNEKLSLKEKELKEKVQSYEEKLNRMSKESREKSAKNLLFTSDLVHLYSNLNKKHRVEAFDSLNLHNLNQNKNAKEFKLKLLFSVIVLAFRFVKLHIREMKRKVKNILQINDLEQINEKSNGQKCQVQVTPTIIVHKPTQDCIKADKFTSSELEISHDASNRTKEVCVENAAELIENALSKYFKMVTLNKSYDLGRLIDEVKEQIWSTLSEYPLKDCQQLNSYITESVKISWSLINHEPSFKLEYAHVTYDSSVHERTENSNEASSKILYYIWPSLIDSADNTCLEKGLVVT